MVLERGQVVERIFPGSDSGVDERHQDVSDDGAMERFVEETVFAVENATFDEPFDDIVGERSARHPEKDSKLCPAFFEVADGLSQSAVGFGLLGFDLIAAPEFEVIDNWCAVLLMVAEAVFVAHRTFGGDGVVAVDSAQKRYDLLYFGRETALQVDKITPAMSEAIGKDRFEVFRDITGSTIDHQRGRRQSRRTFFQKSFKVLSGVTPSTPEERDFMFANSGNERGSKNTCAFRVEFLVLSEKVQDPALGIIEIKDVSRGGKPFQLPVHRMTAVSDLFAFFLQRAVGNRHSKRLLQFLLTEVRNAEAITKECRHRLRRLVPAVSLDSLWERSFEESPAQRASEFFGFVDGRRYRRVALESNEDARVDGAMQPPPFALWTGVAGPKPGVGANDALGSRIFGGRFSAVARSWSRRIA